MKARRHHYPRGHFTAEINRRLPELLAASVVMAVLPSGERVVVKGDHRWVDHPDAIRMEAPDREAAAVLRDTLADDINRMEEGHA